VVIPNRLFKTLFVGAAQQMNAKVLSPVKIYPGSQYQQKLPTKTYRKKR
jgi:hypothetical protein